jgi:acyl carrier protein
VLALLRARLPRHLVPNRITVVPELVHTVSGKIDRAASHRRHAAAAAVAQSVAMSAEDLAAVFSRILEIEHVTAESDFFDAGGDSLLATRVLSVIARESGIELSFDDFARASSPTALAQLISTA